MNFKNNDANDVLLNRRSIRHYNSNFKISREELNQIIKESTSAPSACDLQSWHFVIADTTKAKQKIKPAIMKFNYPQLTTSSAMIAVFADTESYKNYRQFWESLYQNKKISKKNLNDSLNTFLPMYENGNHEFLSKDATIDAALISMELMLVARAHGYDTNPIGGFDAKKLVKECNLDKKRFLPIMIIAVGKRDLSAKEQEVTTRYEPDKFTEYLS